MQNQPTQGNGLMELLGRALIDPKVRDQIYSDPDTLAKQYNLGPVDRDALKNLERSKLDEAASQLAGRADFAIGVMIRGHFDVK
jgi:hypothetical protein